jgi:hypothetical protein
VTIHLDVDGVTVYDDSATAGVGAGHASGSSLVLASGTRRVTAAAASAGGATAQARGRNGFSGDAAGASTVTGVGVALAGSGGSGQHIQLVVDGSTVYDAGSGIAILANAQGRATVTGIASPLNSGTGSAAGHSTATAQGLLPNQAIGNASGRATVNAGLLMIRIRPRARRLAARCVGPATAFRPLDDDADASGNPEVAGASGVLL